MQNQYPGELLRSQDDAVMSTGDWFVTLLILAIPLVNVVMLLVWSLSSSGNRNRRNFCQASMIWLALGLGLFFFAAIVSAIVSS